jgi:hypothetical protein
MTVEQRKILSYVFFISGGLFVVLVYFIYNAAYGYYGSFEYFSLGYHIGALICLLFAVGLIGLGFFILKGRVKENDKDSISAKEE